MGINFFWANIASITAVVGVLGRYAWMYRGELPWLTVLFLYFVMVDVRLLNVVTQFPDGRAPVPTVPDAIIFILTFGLLIALLFTSG